MTTYRFTVNATPLEVDVPGMRRLLDVLREELALTGTKEGCGEGECGACTVLLDGAPVDSCLVPVCQVEGAEILTVEGLAGVPATPGGAPVLDDLQAAFLRAGGAQCGICTPGMLMAARAYIDAGGGPDEDDIREAIAGNLCRCTGYTKIVEAIAIARRRPRVAPVPVEPPVVSPRRLADALDAMADGWSRPIAGGTDLMVALTGELGEPPLRVVDLWGLDELRGMAVAGDGIVLGALTTYTDIRRSALCREHLPGLVEAAATIGAAQIQNRGTLGGNIANASPAGDTLPVLLALDASFALVSVRGERLVPAASFWTEYRRTALAADELVARIRIPFAPGREVRFRKVGTRRAQSISKVVMAVAWSDGAAAHAWRDVRLAIGSVAATPIRAAATEAAIEGRAPNPETADLAAETLAGELHPIDDVRSTAEYRRIVAARVLHRIIREAGGW